MSNGGPPGLAIESYTIEPAGGERALLAAAEGADLSAAATGAPLRLTLRGRGFFIGATDPVIRIGGQEVRDYEILSDERTIVVTLREPPPEGAEISIEFPGGEPAVAPEPFTLDRLGGGPAGPVA